MSQLWRSCMAGCELGSVWHRDGGRAPVAQFERAAGALPRDKDCLAHFSVSYYIVGTHRLNSAMREDFGQVPKSSTSKSQNSDS
eukprot:3413914-Pleurochrysis_carterae.AAC.1